jgi:hypothetical protein
MPSQSRPSPPPFSCPPPPREQFLLFHIQRIRVHTSILLLLVPEQIMVAGAPALSEVMKRKMVTRLVAIALSSSKTDVFWKRNNSSVAFPQHSKTFRCSKRNHLYPIGGTKILRSKVAIVLSFPKTVDHCSKTVDRNEEKMVARLVALSSSKTDGFWKWNNSFVACPKHSKTFRLECLYIV